MRFALWIGLACFWLSVARPAWAVTRFTLDYRAPANCPSREAFLEAVRARAPDAEASELEGSFAFQVRIEAEGELVRGRVKLGHDAAEREVVPAPCADVASSIALMIAIVLAGEKPDATADPAAANATEDTRATPAPAVRPVEKPRQPERRVEAARGPWSPPADASPSAVRFRGGIWGAAGLAGGVAPFPAISVGGGAELWVDLGWLRPSARAGVTHVRGDTSVQARGSAEFRLSGFVGRLCPHAVSLAARWSLTACASLEIGTLTARGVSTPSDLVQRMPWLSFGVAPRAELALGHIVSLEAELGLDAIVRHDRFVFEPGDAEVYDVPRFAPHLALGASARFP